MCSNFVGGEENAHGAAQFMAMKRMMQIVRQQATVMAFADIFLMLTVLFCLLALLSVVMKRPKIAGAGGGH